MTAHNTAVNKSGNNFTFAQDLTFSRADYRNSVAQLGKDIYKLFVADDYKIGIGINTDTPLYSDVAIVTDDTAKIVFCIDRAVTYSYIIARLTSGNVNLFKLYLSTRALTDLGQISTLTSITPLKILIAPNSKIIWLGDNSTLYSMNVDGSSLLSVAFPSKTFSISPDNIIFGSGGVNGATLDTSLNTIHSYSSIFTGLHLAIAAFYYNGYFYQAMDDGVAKIVKVQKESPYNVTTLDLATEYGIGIGTIKKFNLAYTSTDGYFFVICVNNGTSEKKMYKVDTGITSLTPLRQVGSKISGNLTGIFSDDSTTYPTIATIDAGGSNDDWTGEERNQINS